ncbi:hypothetical protein NZK35_25085 [Stieleria sp. ICT_E10.1]|uniref:hypothetical protein n=1 Tax=Stieleria sedimenti TaxID=2976331 RepID=UPI0021801503|nr:hypothetical protein [Stieleria sedimenti]MCS7469941.1 hypothetical protein [Stieleria sedimenti]
MTGIDRVLDRLCLHRNTVADRAEALDVDHLRDGPGVVHCNRVLGITEMCQDDPEQNNGRD